MGRKLLPAIVRSTTELGLESVCFKKVSVVKIPIKGVKLLISQRTRGITSFVQKYQAARRLMNILFQSRSLQETKDQSLDLKNSKYPTLSCPSISTITVFISY